MSDLAQPEGRSLLGDLSQAVGLEPAKFYDAVKRACGCNGATDADFAALLMTAKAYDLNPVMRELWLLDTGRGRIRATISHDGFFKIMVRHPDYLNHTYTVGEDEIGGKYGEVTIYTKAAQEAGVPPYVHREYLEEVRKGSGPWKTHTQRMLRGRTISQGVRHRFAIAAPDPDEAVLVDEVKDVPVDVTPAVAITALGSDETFTRGAEGGQQPHECCGGLTHHDVGCGARRTATDYDESAGTEGATVDDEPWDAAASAALDAEDAAEREAIAGEGLFGE